MCIVRNFKLIFYRPHKELLFNRTIILNRAKRLNDLPEAHYLIIIPWRRLPKFFTAFLTNSHELDMTAHFLLYLNDRYLSLSGMAGRT